MANYGGIRSQSYHGTGKDDFMIWAAITTFPWLQVTIQDQQRTKIYGFSHSPM